MTRSPRREPSPSLMPSTCAPPIFPHLAPNRRKSLEGTLGLERLSSAMNPMTPNQWPKLRRLFLWAILRTQTPCCPDTSMNSLFVSTPSALPELASTSIPVAGRADLRPQNINDAVIRLAGNSQDGIQTAGALLARLAGRSDQEVMTYMTIPSTISIRSRRANRVFSLTT